MPEHYPYPCQLIFILFFVSWLFPRLAVFNLKTDRLGLTLCKYNLKDHGEKSFCTSIGSTTLAHTISKCKSYGDPF